jgi:heme exporter protein D
MFDSIQFSSFSEFLQMGGYAFNVWSVYALFILFLAANLYLPLRRKKQIMRDLKRRLLLNQEQPPSNTQPEATDTAGDL